MRGLENASAGSELRRMVRPQARSGRLAAGAAGPCSTALPLAKTLAHIKALHAGSKPQQYTRAHEAAPCGRPTLARCRRRCARALQLLLLLQGRLGRLLRPLLEGQLRQVLARVWEEPHGRRGWLPGHGRQQLRGVRDHLRCSRGQCSVNCCCCTWYANRNRRPTESCRRSAGCLHPRAPSLYLRQLAARQLAAGGGGRPHGRRPRHLPAPPTLSPTPPPAPTHLRQLAAGGGGHAHGLRPRRLHLCVRHVAQGCDLLLHHACKRASVRAGGRAGEQ